MVKRAVERKAMRNDTNVQYLIEVSVCITNIANFPRGGLAWRREFTLFRQKGMGQEKVQPAHQ